MIQDEINRVLELTETGLSDREIAEIMGFSRRTVGRRRAASSVTTVEEVTGELIEFPRTEDPGLPEINGYLPAHEDDLIERFTPLKVYGDAVVTSDWHIPLHTPELVNKMLDRARNVEINQLIINGDYWHMEAFSSFIPHQPEAALEVERWHGNVAMKTALDTFEHVYMNLGNHDFRLVKKTGFKKSFEECMDWMFYALTDDERSRLHVTSLDYLEYYPEDKGWGRKYRVCHPKNFSIVPLTVPRALAVRYGCSIITGHSHHCAMGVAQDGHNLIIESGGFFNKNRTEYIQSTNRGHEWVQGWVEFTDGQPELVGPNFTNL